VSLVTQAVLVVLALVALWTVQTSILRAAIGLALTSALVSVVIFQMGAPLAAVFELSVCAGLITVVFAATISMTRPLDEAAKARCRVRRRKRFHPLFFVVAGIGVLLWASGYALEVTAPALPAADVLVTSRDLLWSARRLDLVGQLVILFVGVFGVVVLFKERDEAAEEVAR
jgi:NADH-quinone oxidoreductase subunit J